jgi:hypothetical protein
MHSPFRFGTVGRSDRRAQGDRPTLRSITPKHRTCRPTPTWWRMRGGRSPCTGRAISGHSIEKLTRPRRIALSGLVEAVGFTYLYNARLNRRQSGSSEPIMSLIRPARWAGDGARRQIESAGSQPVMSRGTPSTTALLRTPMERPDFVVAGRLPASGDTEASSWPRAVGGQSASPDFNGPTPAGRPAARPGGVGGRGRTPAPRR